MGGHVYVIQGDITRCKADAIGYSTSTMSTRSGMLFRAFTQLDATFAQACADLEQQRWSVADTRYLPPNEARPAVVITFSVGKGFKDPLKTAALLVRRTIECAVSELRKDKPTKRLLILLPSFLPGKVDLKPCDPSLRARRFARQPRRSAR